MASRGGERCHAKARLTCNWMVHELGGLLNAASIWSLDKSPVKIFYFFLLFFKVELAQVSAAQIGSIVDALDSGEVTGAVAKRVIREMFEKKSGESCGDIVARNQWTVVRDNQLLESTAKLLVARHATEAAAFREGDANRQSRTMKFFMGQAMKELKGKADPEELKKELEKALKS
jgi:Asp-tRNA(Asn)/Glu-tRNA(Gln) amidotransferase B subunit